MRRLTAKDIFFIGIISLTLFLLGFYTYQKIDAYYMRQQVLRSAKVVGRPDRRPLNNEVPKELSEEKEAEVTPRPITMNMWTDGVNDYYYLGNRLIQERDFNFSYEGLENYIYVDGVIQDDKVIDAFSEIMQYVPQNVLNSFIENGGQFVFCDEKSMFEYYKQMYGDTQTAWENFYDENYSIDGFIICDTNGYKICYKNDVDSVIRSAIHELGHYIDKMGPTEELLSMSDEFIDIYSRESGASELSDYATNSNDEYFAESFQQMLIDPTYKDRCPETCEYIEKCYRSI